MSLNLQYSKVFSIPRKMFKHFLSFWYPIVIKWYPLPKVKSIPETIDKIVEDNCSICRIGVVILFKLLTKEIYLLKTKINFTIIF